MDYTTRLGDRETQAHVNYRCPCGCQAGLTYDKDSGAEHLGQCCCGRLLWVGADSEDVVRSSLSAGREYQFEKGTVRLPWGEAAEVTLAVPQDAVETEEAKRLAGKTPQKVIDPVCKMMIDPDEAAGSSTFQGTKYYFCAVACKERFDAEPGRYVETRSFLSRLLKRS